jgi:hypothetical protein
MSQKPLSSIVPMPKKELKQPVNLFSSPTTNGSPSHLSSLEEDRKWAERRYQEREEVERRYKKDE